MVDKEKLDLEIRLTAIEYLLINMEKQPTSPLRYPQRR